MADDGKLYIIITDKREDDGKGGNTPSSSSQKEAASKKTAQSYAVHQFYNFVTSQAKQFVTYNIQNIGNFTGNYVTQRKVSEAVNVLTIGMNIATAGIAGFKIGGPIGAAVSTAIAVAGTAINAGYQSYTQRIENAKTNYNIDQLRRRSGLNVYTDGSRGTEN